MNVNTYKYSNKLRFPISFGIFPDMLFPCKYLSDKNHKYDILCKNMIEALPFVYFKQKYGRKYLQHLQ